MDYQLTISNLVYVRVNPTNCQVSEVQDDAMIDPELLELSRRERDRLQNLNNVRMNLEEQSEMEHEEMQGNERRNTGDELRTSNVQAVVNIHRSNSSRRRVIAVKRRMLRRQSTIASDDEGVHNATHNLVNIATTKTGKLTKNQALARKEILVSSSL